MATPRRTLLRAAPLVALCGLAWPASGLTSSGGSSVDSGGRDAFYGATAAADGGVLLVGTRQSRAIDEPSATETIPEGYALALASDGSTAWERTYASPLGSPAEVQEDWIWTAIPRTDEGYVLVGIGYNAGPDAETGWVQAVDDQGERVWRWSAGEADTGNSFNDTLAGVARTADGYLLAGRTGGGSAIDDAGSDGWLVALSEDGALRWHDRYAAGDVAAGHDEFRAVLPREEGWLLAGEGSPGDGGGATAGWLVGVDADGAVDFERTYRPRAGKNVLADGVRTPDGGYLFVGTSYGGESWRRRHYHPLPQGQGWLLSVDERGERRWSRLLGASSQCLAVTPARTSGYVVAGARDGAGWVARVDGDGELQETYRSPNAVAYGGIAPFCEDTFVAAGWTATEEKDEGEDGEEGEDSAGDAVSTRLRMGVSRFAVVAHDDAPRLSYEFTADGPVERVTDAGRDSADSTNDAIAEDGDTYTVSGVTGSGYGDTYTVAGEICSFSTDASGDHLRLLLDGEDVTDEYLEGTSRFVVRSSADAPRFSYEFTASGEVTRVTTAGQDAAEATNDEIAAHNGTYVVSGVAGSGYGDTYDVAGEVVEFRTDASQAHLTLVYDGDDVTEDLLGGGTARLFEVVAGEDAPRFAYEFAVDGPVERVTDAGRNAAEETNDEITETATGYRVSGVTGSGYGDSYQVYGAVSEFSATVDSDRYTLLLDGEDVTR